jgi:hypothetical protein
MTFSISASEIRPSYSFSASNRASSVRTGAPIDVAEDVPSTDRAWGLRQCRSACLGRIRRWNSLSSPAMIRSTVDLPAPFAEHADLGARIERQPRRGEFLCGGTTIPQVLHREDVLLGHDLLDSFRAKRRSYPMCRTETSRRFRSMFFSGLR